MESDACLVYEREAASFVLGDIPAELRPRMVAHLESCGPCRRQVTTLAATLDSISATTEPMEPSAGFVQRVLAAADAAPREEAAPAHLCQDHVPPICDERDRSMAVTLPATQRLRFLAHRQEGRPVTVVVRRRRTIAVLTGAAASFSVLALTLLSWPLLGLALAATVLDVSYLALVRRVTRTKALLDLATAFPTQPLADDAFWRELQPEMLSTWAVDEGLARPVATVDNTALAHFVFAYFLGWALTPVVALIRLLRGDLAGIEQTSPLLGDLVALQRRGRSQSLRLLVAGATTVAVAGGGAATTLFVAPGVAGASTGQTYVVQRGDTLSAIAERYEMSVSTLAEINGIRDADFIVPGEVIKFAGAASTGAAYTVQAGDTLDAIAARCGTTVAALASLNGISDPNLIFAGQTLALPAGAGAGTVAPASETTAHSYTVQAGDTLNTIAARFGVSAATLAAANGIADPNFIEVGQVLALTATPAQSAVATRGTSAPTPAPAPPTASAPVSSGYVDPFASGSWSASRIDEGVDWIPHVASPVVAIGNGVITYSSMRSGWPAGGFISYRLTSGSHAGLSIYVAEHITNLLPVGTVVSAGQQIATALPGYPWTEWGWASASGPAPAPGSRYGGARDGTATAGGMAFARFLISLGVPGVPSPGPGPTTP